MWWDRLGKTVDMARRRYKYSRLPTRKPVLEARESLSFWVQNHQKVLKGIIAATAAMILWYLAADTVRAIRPTTHITCESVTQGYHCQPEISHFWGQYSPFFATPRDESIESVIPDTCTLTFAQVLSRHGARDPTASKTAVYNATIARIQASVAEYGPGFEFIREYNYTLGADQLTSFGQQELVNSGEAFYKRYAALASDSIPFVRSSGRNRVVLSAHNWTQGFHAARTSDGVEDASYPYEIVVISEDTGSNNTLNHGLCETFEEGPYSEIGANAQSVWMDVFTRDISTRLNAGLPGAILSARETIYMMDLCPFNTVADPQGKVSEFCGLFTIDEWRQYDYYQSLGKYYGYGAGNPLGSTQGVGFTNELIARLTGQPVAAQASINRTLDSNPATFPLKLPLYADFSHDNAMTAAFFALGLYNGTTALSNTTVQGAEALDGYSAAWTVPFAARIYIEKMSCDGEAEELVRILVNDRVRPLTGCGADAMGRCSLSAFIDSLNFARSGGNWDACFAGRKRGV